MLRQSLRKNLFLLFLGSVLLLGGVALGYCISRNSQEIRQQKAQTPLPTDVITPISPTVTIEGVATCTEQEFMTMLINEPDKLKEFLLKNLSPTIPVIVTLPQQGSCSFDLVSYLNKTAASLDQAVADGFSDYFYLKDQTFLLGRWAEIWSLDIKTRKITSLWKLPEPSYALSLVRMEVFDYPSDRIVVFQVAPSGLGGTATDSENLSKLIENSCNSESAGFWALSTRDYSVKKISSLSTSTECLR